MQTYYFGLTLEQAVIAFVISSAMAVFVSYKYINGSEKLVVPVFICVALAVPLMSISIDLRQVVTPTKWSALDVAIEDSKWMRNGQEFQNTVNDLLEKKGGVVYSNTSYANKSTSTMNISKSDWNKLAKVYNNLEDEG